MNLYIEMTKYLSNSLLKSGLSEEQIDKYLEEIVNEKVVGFNAWTRMGKLYQANFWW